MTVTAGVAAYDSIAAAYQLTKSSPLRSAVEAWTLDRHLGDPTGLAILDAGCGDGHHARRWLAADAARITAVDISAEMIRLARMQPGAGQIDYREGAVERLPVLGAFDVVVASYLFHYAADVATLTAMFGAMRANLKPTGRLVALVENPDQSPADYAGYEAYGFGKRSLEPRAEGSRVRYAMVAGRRLIEFDVRWFSRGVYERALTDCRFRDVRWHPLELSPAAADQAGYYRAYLANPPVLALTALGTSVP